MRHRVTSSDQLYERKKLCSVDVYSDRVNLCSDYKRLCVVYFFPFFFFGRLLLISSFYGHNLTRVGQTPHTYIHSVTNTKTIDLTLHYIPYDVQYAHQILELEKNHNTNTLSVHVTDVYITNAYNVSETRES